MNKIYHCNIAGLKNATLYHTQNTIEKIAMKFYFFHLKSIVYYILTDSSGYNNKITYR